MCQKVNCLHLESPKFGNITFQNILQWSFSFSGICHKYYLFHLQFYYSGSSSIFWLVWLSVCHSCISFQRTNSASLILCIFILVSISLISALIFIIFPSTYFQVVLFLFFSDTQVQHWVIYLRSLWFLM
jgi:hypothetical protein